MEGESGGSSSGSSSPSSGGSGGVGGGGGEETGNSAATSRWTCVACGCRTNTASDRSCSICGTSNQPLGAGSFFRRSAALGRTGAGGAGDYSAPANRASWVASRLRRAVPGNDSSAAAAAAAAAADIWDPLGGAGSLDDMLMQVAAASDVGASGAGLNPLLDNAHAGALSHMMNSRFLEAARAFSNLEHQAAAAQQAAAAAVVAAAAAAHHQQQQAATSPTSRVSMNPNEVLTAATLAAPDHGPLKWANPSTLIVPRHSSSSSAASSPTSGIRVHDNLAHLPMGSPEGRAIRLETPLNLNSSFGFRVAFDHPGCGGIGESMGGCYLVGVVTSSFSQYGDANALFTSPYFYGIEDCGRKYEGGRRGNASSLASAAGRNRFGANTTSNNSSTSTNSNNAVPAAARGPRRPGTTSLSPFAQDLSPAEVPFNAHNVLFGCQEVVTVVYHMGTLTFWRGDVLLGTLITSLPRGSGSLLYPVVVPFNRGVTVAITGLEANPVPLLRTFAADWKQAQLDQDNQKRHKLAQERATLIQNGRVTGKLRQVLISIFQHYASQGETTLSFCAAAHLWYRCGMKLSCLETLLETQQRSNVELDDFLHVIDQVAAEDEIVAATISTTIAVGNNSPPGSPAKLLLDFPCQIGDKVELVPGYEKFGDASGGPLNLGDRGIVVDTQNGPNGDRRSVRVLFDGRRWWYQPQAIVAERSGLIETPGVWFLKSLLRSHSYDHSTLAPLDQVTKSTFAVGDWVKCKTGKTSEAHFGRIATESSCSSPARGSIRDSGVTVPVEFVDKAFGDACGVKLTGSDLSSTGLVTRRIRTSKIVHCTPLPLQSPETDTPEVISNTYDLPRNASDRLFTEIAALSRLDRAAMDCVTKECGKSSDALASLFSGGLPNAVLTSIDVAERQMASLEPREDLPEKISGIGKLSCLIAKQLFATESPPKGDDSKGIAPATANESSEEHPPPPLDSVTQSAVSASSRSVPSRDSPSRRGPPRRMRMRDMMPRRDALRRSPGEDHAQSAAQNMAALQQRRNMLLSLMSRSRRGQSSFFNDLMERESAIFGGDIPPVPPLLGPQNPPLAYMDPLNAAGSWDEAVSDTSPSNGQINTFLDSILRSRASGERSCQIAGPSTAVFVRHLVSTGLLMNSVAWLKACVDSQTKRIQLTSSQKSASLLKGLVDDDGTPLLHLAISFGCKAEVLNFLISHGSVVETIDVLKAAETDQSECLRVLLKHAPYQDVELSEYSHSVQLVFAEAKARQEQLDQKMRDEVGGFMIQLLRRLLKFGLKSRRRSLPRVELCSKTIAEVLVGNVLLQSLQTTQRSESGTVLQSDVDHERKHFGRDADDDATEYNISTEGLLRLLPASLVFQAYLSDDNIASFFSLIEDFLCSKDMYDGAAGLSLLLIILTKFPDLRQSGEMRRFGMMNLVSFHDDLASHRLSAIQSRQSRSGHSSKEKAVCCPSKHTAVLFVTRHSSFRCDICGNGVDRGRPMHGCRECDWDACEVCTDKSQSGLVKCNAIKDLAATIRSLLSEPPLNPDAVPAVAEEPQSSTLEFQDLATRLLSRDIRALRDIGVMLLTPGKISIHQFLCVLLPSFHSAYVSNSDEDDLHSSTGRRTKKARVIDGLSELSLESPEDKLKFCIQSIRLLVSDNDTSEDDDKKPSVVDSDDEPSHAVDEAEPCSSSSIKEVNFSEAFQELLRRLHQILAMRERVEVISSVPEDSPSSPSSDQKSGDLQCLTKSIMLRLSPSKFGLSHACTDDACASDLSLLVHVEPLLPVNDLVFHVLRTCRFKDSSYMHFCKELARDRAIIVERPLQVHGSWRIAEVTSFDESTGAHTVRYGSSLAQGYDVTTVLLTHRDQAHCLDGVLFDQSEETFLVLAARQNFIICRRYTADGERKVQFTDSPTVMDIDSPRRNASSSVLRESIGSRVEHKRSSDESWEPHTLISIDSSGKATVVSDTGVITKAVSPAMVRVPKTPTVVRRSLPRNSDPGIPAWARDDRAAMNPSFPFLSTNRQRSQPVSETQEPEGSIVMKRTWSALSLVESTRPVDLRFSGQNATSQAQYSFKVRVGENDLVIACDSMFLETPPKLSVNFSLHEKLPGNDFTSCRNTTVVGALRQMQMLRDKSNIWHLSKSVQLFYTIEADPQGFRFGLKASSDQANALPTSEMLQFEDAVRCEMADFGMSGDRSRKLSSRSLTGEEDFQGIGLCEGFDEVCLQCMEALSLLSEFAHDNPVQSDRDVPVESLFANSTLSKKLTDQLDDALVVVGRALPEWCVLAPSFAPRVFSYESRKLLLERYAFGVSRSALKQQEAKTNVGRLRQRMASLRARAVELVGEAFSGGAEDPTALQLQADELYGMEEALAARVRAAFRALKWQEHVLEVAKAVVRREYLLLDSTAAMQRFAESDVCQRRLEVRFDGESGFDAASGTEAGVTRGFYADVAEALLSTDNVAGVYCATSCSYLSTEDASSETLKLVPMDIDGARPDASKLPLWIPDLDTSAQVVIPTPRADVRSSPGVFPRPLPHYHPQLPDVLDRFRFMGRLFAAAIRDGFMFPLPLSSSFLKLVLQGNDPASSTFDGSKAASIEPILLTSSDLPRAGFLGGEVFAAESYVCKLLDSIDALDPPLSGLELARRYKEIASDRKFARVALGKLFDCSFEDYFQDRTFVDPLDPTQGEDAVPLCPNGHSKHVTIYNVREWLALCKKFILHDGVIAQAQAFRLGVEDFFSADYLRLFTPEELQRDICGVGDNVDTWDESAVRKLFKLDGGKGAAEALVAVAAIGGEGGAAMSRRFGPSSPTISFLVKALVDATPQQRRQFLNFVTSVPIVTPGRIEIVPMVSPAGEFLPMNDPSCLPRANTCARKLYLPKFESQDSFSQVLWAVVREESKFKGFFEWRGT